MCQEVLQHVRFACMQCKACCGIADHLSGLNLLIRCTSDCINPCSFLRCRDCSADDRHRRHRQGGAAAVAAAARRGSVRAQRARRRAAAAHGRPGRQGLRRADRHRGEHITVAAASSVLRSEHLRSRAHIFRLCSPPYAMAAVHVCSGPAAARVINLRTHSWAQLRCKRISIVREVSLTGVRYDAGWDLRGTAPRWRQHGVVLDWCLVLARHLRHGRHDRCGSVCLTLPCPLLLTATRCCNGMRCAARDAMASLHFFPAMSHVVCITGD